MRPLLRRAAYAALIAALILGPMVFRALYEARYYLLQAQQAKSNSQWDQAIDNYRKSAIWDFPGNRWAKAARAEFKYILDNQVNDAATREQGWREYRRALFSSRSFLAPLKDSDPEVIAIDREIEKLAGSGRSEIQELYPPTVNYGWQAAAQFSFWGWVGGIFYAIWRGTCADGSLNRSQLMWGIYCAGGCFAFWLIALRLA